MSRIRLRLFAAAGEQEMQEGRASETAYRAGRARAWHQVVDVPKVFDDPIAARFLREEDARKLRNGTARRGSPLARAMRLALAVRSRIAEDALHQAVARGVRQYVVLGAGFDTFAFRNPHAARGLRIFEVDHPDTQHIKRRRMVEAGLATPPGLAFVPVDFASQSLAEQLWTAGFASDEPAFFAFLGVSVYLEAGALQETLRFIASCAKGSEVVFDYVVKPASLSLLDRFALRLAALRCARVGEPWKSFLDPDLLPAQLEVLGFSMVHGLTADEILCTLRSTLGPAERRIKPPRFGMGRLMMAAV